jgi:ankyrin repeat protein
MITGDSVLHLAVFQDKNEFIKTIITEDEGQTPLYEFEEINMKNEDGNTPVSYACIRGNLELVRILHKKGAVMTHRNIAGLTPLLLAIYHQHYFIVHYLLSIESVFDSVQTALDFFKCI